MAILRRWFEEVWNQGKESTIDELAMPDVRGHGLVDASGNEVTGIESFKEFYHQFRAGFSDIHIDVLETVAEGDLEVARFVVTGKHTGDGLGKMPKGNDIKITGMTMVRTRSGKIQESWNNVDFLSMFQQME